MWLKFLFLVVNLLALKVDFSEATVKPTFTYTSKTLPTVQSTPANNSPTSTTPTPTVSSLGASTASAAPVSSSPTLTSVATSVPAKPASSSPSSIVSSPKRGATPTVVASPLPAAIATQSPTYVAPAQPKVITTQAPVFGEAKAYFLPGPVPNPKVTILADSPAIAEAKPRICADSNIIEIVPLSYPDPGVIEVKGKFYDPESTGNGPLPLATVIPVQEIVRDSDTASPVKRVIMACKEEDPFVNPSSSRRSQNQQSICPGITEMEGRIPHISRQKATNNPIDFEGLFEGFMTCL